MEVNKKKLKLNVIFYNILGIVDVKYVFVEVKKISFLVIIWWLKVIVKWYGVYGRNWMKIKNMKM